MTHPPTACRRAEDERGISMALEVVLLVPVLLLVLGTMVAGGRYWYARTTVERAAASASRAATLQRSASAAGSAARFAATTELDSAMVTCESHDVTVDVSGFAVPVGQPAEVFVTVACTVTFADLLVPGWPGRLAISHTASSVLDRYRERHS
jgi:Flp pilus assembly protein TadG